MLLFTLLIFVIVHLCSASIDVTSIDVGNSDELLYRLCSTSSPGDSTVLYLMEKRYTLEPLGFCVIRDVSNMRLESLTGHSTVNCLSQKSGDNCTGFGFVNVTNITITGVHFIGCGSTLTKEAVIMINDTHPHIGYLQKAVLIFNHCYNITLKHVSIQSYSGYAIMMMNPLGHSLMHKVNVSNGVSANHQSCLRSKAIFLCAGSGIMCVLKDTTSTINIDPIYVTLSESSFKFNMNIIYEVPRLDIADGNSCTLPLIGASALSLVFNQTFHATFSCENTTFKDNFGTIAGSLLIMYFNGMLHSQALFTNASFLDTSLVSKTKQLGGSGIAVFSLPCFTSCPVHFTGELSTPLSIINCTLRHDGFKAYHSHVYYGSYGSGLFLNIFYICGSSKFVVLVKNTVFHHNYAQLSGSSIYAFVSNDIRNSVKVILSLILENAITHGIPITSYQPSSVSKSAMSFINWNNVTIIGGLFRGSIKTTIAAYNSKVYITESVLFANNKGANGAAFNLVSSHLILQEPLNASFINNTALLYGGAVYITNKIIPGQDSKCGLQLLNKSRLGQSNIRLNFQGNKAGLAGDDMYANPLYNCTMHFLKQSNIVNVLHRITDGNNKGIVSEPVKLCSCAANTNKILTSCPITHVYQNIIDTYPGKVIKLSLCAVDASGSIVYSAAVASIEKVVLEEGRKKTNQTYLYLKQQQKLTPLSGMNCTVVQYNFYNKLDKALYAYLNIATPGNSPSWLGNVYILPCPLGFELSNDECVCNQFITNIIPDAKCNITNTLIFIHSGQWLGNISNTLSFSFLCPPGNCLAHVSHVNMSDLLSLCQESKQGLLCGQCRPGLSVVFGTSQCMQCSNYWLLTLIGYVLSGILLVLILLYLPLTISEGPLAGFIIAMNLTAVSTIDLLEGEVWYLYVTRVCVSLVNLGLGFPLCLYNGMTPLVKIGLQFLYPVYLWVLIIGFTIFSHYSTVVSNKTAMHSVQVLATLLYLSFSKVLMTIIDIIAYIPVHISHNGTMLVWYGDGSVQYLSFSDGHLFLFILSVVALLFCILPFILFVTFGGHCQRWRLVNKYLRQFLEAFQGPYKQSKGYWFGVRVLVLAYVYLMWGILRGYDLNLMLLLQLIPLSVLCSFQLYLKPFRSRLLNRMDSFCLAVSSLQMILVISLYGKIATLLVVFLNMFVFTAIMASAVILLLKRLCCASKTAISDGNNEIFENDDMRNFIFDAAAFS